MQYHLNGFKPGNYQIPDAAREPDTPPPITALPDEVDVLIVGCGPAGLALARQLADIADIKTCIVEQKPGPMLFGQADGISCRTLEIMEAFNSSELLVKECYQLHQNAFWCQQHPSLTAFHQHRLSGFHQLSVSAFRVSGSLM
ncbi:MAG: hypothetical protein CMI01_14600, partial [Oceanospirillaceae bacterium]|nr:hypothetical protein [Oceanospirillaceae bacterium]